MAQVAVKVARVACVQAERGVTVAEQRDFFDSVETEMPQRWLSCCKVRSALRRSRRSLWAKTLVLASGEGVDSIVAWDCLLCFLYGARLRWRRL